MKNAMSSSSTKLSSAQIAELERIWSNIWDKRMRDVEVHYFMPPTPGWGFDIGGWWFGKQPQVLPGPPAAADRRDFFNAEYYAKAKSTCLYVAQKLTDEYGAKLCVRFRCDPAAKQHATGNLKVITPSQEYLIYGQ